MGYFPFVAASSGGGSVSEVTGGDLSVVAANPTGPTVTLETGTFDVLASLHPAAGAVTFSNQKATNLTNGSGAQDGAAFGQTLAGGDLAPLTTAGDLLYANATPAPARLAIGTAPQLLGISAGVPAWVSQDYGGTFGDGSDGSVTFDGMTTILGLVPSVSTYTMTRDIFCTGITINNGVTLKCQGYRIFCAGTVTNNGTISANGANASGASAGGAGQSGTIMGGNGGAAGATGAGGQGFNSGTCFGTGAGGAGGSGTSGAGGTGKGSFTTTAYPHRIPAMILSGASSWQGAAKTPGGAPSGSAGAGDGTNSGGGGGAGGGLIAIMAWAVNNGSGTISAAGGNGGTPPTGNCGGGGSGGGGLILVNTLSAWTAGTTSVAAGTQGSGVGSGAAGSAGGSGTVLNVVLL
jgi:hypothetical protein